MSGPVVVIEQPNYIPWVGYFDLLMSSDTWVWYDDVQYTRRDWRNRNRVAGKGNSTWLTIPVKVGKRDQTRICDVRIDADQRWPQKHLATIRGFYGKAPFFDLVFPVVEEHLLAGHELLADLTIELNEALCTLMNIDAPRFLRSSQMSGVQGSKQTRLLSICQQLQCGTYLSGPAARDYIEPQAFAQNGYELAYISYDYPPYDRGNRGFPDQQMAIIDPLVWLGPEQTRDYITQFSKTMKLRGKAA